MLCGMQDCGKNSDSSCFEPCSDCDCRCSSCIPTTVLEDSQQVETPDNPFIILATMEYMQPFMKIIGYQGDVDKVSAFYMKYLAQPWQNMFKVFNRFLTSRTSGHVQTKINILHIFHVMVNRIHVDYASLLGMLILDKFITDNIHATEEYKEYEKAFVGVDVSTIQPQLVESTQGKIRTPSAHRTPTPTTIAGDVVKNKRNRKQTAGEASSPKPSLKIHVKKLKLSVDLGFQDDDDDFGNRIEPGSHKEHPKNDDDDDAIHKNVDNILHDIIPKIASNAKNDIIEYNLSKVIVEAFMKERDMFQETIPALISKEFADHAPKTDTFRGSDHDDHQNDDAPPKGEKRAKKAKDVKKLEICKSDVDKVIPEDDSPELIEKFQNVDKHVPTVYYHEIMEATLKDMTSNQFRNAEEYAYHLEQSTNYMENQIVWESRQEDIRRSCHTLPRQKHEV
ncbi:hypothetical protein Tco_0162315 [Tanacetum coccineum]